MTIKEVSKKMNIKADTLRFYEKCGLIGEVERDKSGYRNYQENDIKRIEFVKCMRNAELPIEVLKQYLDLYDKGDKTKEERKMLLIKQKEVIDNKIKDMQEASKRLEYKIKLYSDGALEKNLVKNN